MLRKALAWAVLLLAGSVLAAELLVYRDTGAYTALDLQGVWLSLAPASMIWIEEQILHHAPAQIWDPGIITALKAPVWSVAAALGLAIFPWRAA